MNIDFQDKIDEYVLDRMSETERKELEKEICHDIKKKEQLQLTQDIISAIKSRKEKLALIAEFETECLKKTTHQSTQPSKRNFRIWLAGAISIAAIFTIVFFLPMPKNSTKHITTLSDTISDKSLSHNHFVSSTSSNYNRKRHSNKINNTDSWYTETHEYLTKKKKKGRIFAQTLKSEELQETEHKKLLTNNQKDTTSEVAYNQFIANGKKSYGISFETHDAKAVTRTEQISINGDSLAREKCKFQQLWIKANSLIELGQFEEVISILEQLRNQACEYQIQADSLYRIVKNK